MKINLFLDEKDYLNGYTNICPFEILGKDYLIGEVTNFNNPEGIPICCDGEANEIVVNNILEYFLPKDIDGIIDTWVKKLAFGGYLTIKCTDIELIAYSIIHGTDKDIIKINQLVYGEQDKGWNNKKSAFSSFVIINMLVHRKLKIIKNLSQDFSSIIVAQREEF